jgi:hypothetical protein
MTWEYISKWMDSNTGLAAWLQAVFSVITIVFAVWFPIKLERAKRQIVRIDCLQNLLYAAVELILKNQDLLRVHKGDIPLVDWFDNDITKEIELLSRFVHEMPVGMFVGLEMRLLLDLRAGYGKAAETIQMIVRSHEIGVHSDDDDVRLSLRIKKAVAQAERIRDSVKKRIEDPLTDSWFPARKKRRN